MAELNKEHSPIESIPPADLIRERLRKNVQENRLLRQLLRVSERVEAHKGELEIGHA
jgi:hypothetical protein